MKKWLQVQSHISLHYRSSSGYPVRIPRVLVLVSRFFSFSDCYIRGTWTSGLSFVILGEPKRSHTPSAPLFPGKGHKGYVVLVPTWGVLKLLPGFLICILVYCIVDMLEAHPECWMPRHTCPPLFAIMILNSVYMWEIKQDSLPGYCSDLILGALTMMTWAGSWPRTLMLTGLLLGKVVQYLQWPEELSIVSPKLLSSWSFLCCSWVCKERRRESAVLRSRGC